MLKNASMTFGVGALACALALGCDHMAEQDEKDNNRPLSELDPETRRIVWVAASQWDLDKLLYVDRNGDLDDWIGLHDDHGESYLMRVTRHENQDEVGAWLIKRGFDTHHVASHGTSIIHVAAGAGNIRTLAALLEAGVDIDKPDGVGQTPLYWAVEEDRLQTARWLLHQGADAEARVDGGTLLHAAAEMSSATMIRWLIDEVGLDPAAEDDLGMTAHDVAEAWNNEAAAAVLPP